MKQKGSVDFLLRQQKVEKMDFYALAKFWGVEESQDKEAGWRSETTNNRKGENTDVIWAWNGGWELNSLNYSFKKH